MRKWFLLVLLLLQNRIFHSQTEESRQIVKKLCSPEFHGRGYVAGGDSIAADYLADLFKKRGIKPLKGSYFQSFYHSVNTFPDQMCFVNGKDTLVPGVDYLVDPSCPKIKSILRFRRISVAEAMDKNSLQHAIGEVVSGGRFNSFLFDKRSVTADTLKLLQGIDALLATFAHTIVWTDEKLTWSVSPRQERYAFVHVSGKVNLEKELLIQVSASLIKNYHSRNVTAWLPATKKTRKTIVLSAHYDHLGRMGEHTYFPGANDNASGTASMMSVASELLKQKRKYNVLFIAFAGEEAGLVGSKYFTEHPLIKLKHIRFVLNLDIMGSGEEGITVVNATKHPEEFALLQKVNSEHQLLVQIKQRGPAANSDHYWFSEKGVPAFFIYTMGPNKNYHDVFDTYENLSFAETSDLVNLITRYLEEL